MLATVITVANAALPIYPLTSAFKSIDNGGVKSAIDAYKDGIGVEIVDKPGVATNNSAMNTLVYKYGEDAKISGITVLSQVMTTGTSIDKVIAEELIIDGANCNDNNAGTTGETYLNGVCQGGTSIVILKVAGNGLSYSDCEPTDLTFNTATATCAAKGMRLPTLAETAASVGLVMGVPFCERNWTFTSNPAAYNNTQVYPYSVMVYTFSVRCVK